MFVSIDMDKLVFLHKHHDQDTLGGLAFLEAPDRSVMVENAERTGWIGKMSELDMGILYKNTTGVQIMPGRWVEVQRAMIAALVERLPPTLALPDEVAAQVAAVEANLYKGIAYKYALGAKVPSQAQELFPLQAKPLSESQADDVARKVPPPPPPGATPAAPIVATDSPATEPATPKAARTGGVRQIVWGAADKLLAELGQPAFFADWIATRKKLIEQLEADGYHPTTIRIKLSEWHKQTGSRGLTA